VVAPMPEETIVIVTDDIATPTERVRGWQEEVRGRLALKEVELNVADLERKMASFLQMVGRLFQQAERQVEPRTGMQLDEVELSVEIGGKGEIKLVAGGEVSGKGAIKLKFKRSDVK
jgi:hypothetical protein